jgi:hypothetical protein
MPSIVPQTRLCLPYLFPAKMLTPGVFKRIPAALHQTTDRTKSNITVAGIPKFIIGQGFLLFDVNIFIITARRRF